jgi:hypothetical protein
MEASINATRSAQNCSRRLASRWKVSWCVNQQNRCVREGLDIDIQGTRLDTVATRIYRLLGLVYPIQLIYRTFRQTRKMSDQTWDGEERFSIAPEVRNRLPVAIDHHPRLLASRNLEGQTVEWVLNSAASWSKFSNEDALCSRHCPCQKVKVRAERQNVWDTAAIAANGWHRASLTR